MYSHEEDIDSAIEVFTQAIQWYQHHQVNKGVKPYKGTFLHKNEKAALVNSQFRRTEIFQLTISKMECIRLLYSIF